MGHGSKHNPYQVFHSTYPQLRKNLHLILVGPEEPGNIGAVLRVRANMGIQGRLVIIGDKTCLGVDTERFAKHAKEQIAQIEFFPTLSTALETWGNVPKLSLAASARIGSSDRPHPLWVREGVERAVQKLVSSDILDLVFVFGRESSGLTNDEVSLCDWVVTIPSSPEYRSLNLAQAVMIFCYEVNVLFTQKWESLDTARISQKQRLVNHIVQLAETVGFIHDGDPHKMRPRLEQILDHLPNHIRDVRTIHGFLDQAIRSIKRGSPDFKGRFRE